jgi:transcriptional regulator with XRE-family HTH domain
MDAVPETYFSAKLRELRGRAGLTQAALAEKAGLKRLAVARMETGVSVPSWPSAVALAAALGVSVQEFVGPMVPRRPGKKR